jgi:hypothetical protein
MVALAEVVYKVIVGHETGWGPLSEDAAEAAIAAGWMSPTAAASLRSDNRALQENMRVEAASWRTLLSDVTAERDEARAALDPPPDHKEGRPYVLVDSSDPEYVLVMVDGEQVARVPKNPLNFGDETPAPPDHPQRQEQP